ncbi:aldo/keto reductase family oxidoreductase [Colwellia sp. C1TZA3]|uniref:aldo/keto reductase n=1 Tax=Colwellia sp. C1TZA3 TaxID=2508879 RepID=UPI0011B95F2C|nr:aldo/keto reductase [Colwellia sp. C1TZA3]TWX65100.1 aldo/keto reductase [Colwellia sp. C1TZA3]
MKKVLMGNSNIESSRLIYGCMRIAGDNSTSDRNKGKAAITAALEAGYNHFDHADIYGAGESESIFGELLAKKPHLREQIILTSKAGIRPRNNEHNTYAPKRYDFSQQYLLASVEGSLKRLNTDYLDMFLLHRPDYLFDVHEVAETFALLKASGKVKHFGVSNFKPSQVELLKSALAMPLLVNQVEINIHNIDSLLDGTLDQCQQYGITPIAWCPLGGVAYSAWGNSFSGEDEQRIENELSHQSEKYACTPWQVILAWLLKHPANICPIIGSTTPERIVAAKQALTLDYSREDWYRLLEARNGQAVP